MSNFVHLHVHSYYSLLDGLSSPSKLVKKAKENGMEALALTDHGVMYGVIEFYKACKAEGIKPLIGVEAYVAPNGRLNKDGITHKKSNHLILIAKNFTGYQNLIKLTTWAHLEGFYYKPRIDYELLEKYGEGLVCTSSCLKGEIPEALANNNFEKANKLVEKYKSFFAPGDFYLEVQYHDEIPIQQIVNERMIKLANDTDTKVVATNDVHYADSSNREAHDVLLCIQTGRTVDEENRMRYNGVFSLKTEDEMRSYFQDTPEVITNTLEIAEKCNLEIPLGQQLLPSFKTPNKQSSKEYLRELCEDGFLIRYGKADNEKMARERLIYELKVIDEMGFSTYFLIVWDFIKYAKDCDIVVGPGRGSAAGSIVSYCLNITDIDPLKYNLLFERFLNPARISMPDIDIDFADDRREEVLDYVIEKYGQHNVAQIITFGTMGAKAAIRDTGRALGLSYSYVDKIAKMIPVRPGVTITQAIEEEIDLKNVYDELPEAKELIDKALQLEGVIRHASTHACAVVISEKPLTEYTPLQTGTKGEKTLVTQYSMKPIENIGLLKMDFLGLKNLTILERTQKIIKRTRGRKIDLLKIPLEDKKTFSLLKKASTMGIFQLESGGMRRYLKSLKPTNIEDIIAMISLYRPGSLDMKVSGNRTMVDIYIETKHGKIKAKYLDPSLEPILKETYGVIIYQEQILKIAQDFAGYSLGEADLLRRAIGKKIKSEIDAQKGVFIKKASENGKTAELAEKIFSFIEPFARYGFNKSHAACYAVIAYQTAYLKTHYPVEFLAACLSCDFGNNDRVVLLMEESNKNDIKILPPSVNESLKNFTVTENNENIRFGLAAIKNIGEGPAKAIIEARKKSGPFKDIEDFIARLGPKFANRKVLESLAKCGALDDFIERNALLHNIEQILAFSKALDNDTNQNQDDLFTSIGGMQSAKPKLKLKKVDQATGNEKLKWEKELIGMYVSMHPLAEYKDYYEKNLTLINTLGRGYGNKNLKIGGIITSVKEIYTKKGDKMCFMVLEDYSGSMEVIVFNGVYKRFSSLLKVDQIILLEGKLSFKDSFSGSGEEIKFIADKIKKFDIARMSGETQKHRLEVKISKDEVDLKLPTKVKMDHLMRIKKILQGHKGSFKLNLLIADQNTGKYQSVRIPFLVEFTDEIHTKLDAVFG